MRTWVVRALTFMLAAAMVGAFTLSVRSEALAQDDEEPNQTDIQEILDSPDDLYGSPISVVGEVGEILTPRAFTMISDDADGELLVSGSSLVIPGNLGAGDMVEATGTLREFTSEDEDTFRDVDLNPNAEVYSEFVGEPVVVARSITFPDQQVTDETDDGTTVTTDRTPLRDVFDDFDLLLGETITVFGDVEDFLGQDDGVLNPRAITISSDDVGDQLLVVAEANVMPNSLTEDAVVRVTGTLQSFDPDDPFEWGGDDIGIDPEDDFFTDFEDEPVVVADSVTIVVPALGQMVDNIVEDPDLYYSETVTVLGRVSEVIDPLRSFTLEGTEGWLGITDDDLLVIGPSSIVGETDLVLDDDAIVRVTGTVRFFDPDDPFEVGQDFGDEWEDEEGFFFDDEEEYSEWEDDEVLVAESMDVIVINQGETIENILDDPDAYMGETVTVVGNINDLISDQAMTLEGTEGFLGITEDNLLVVGAADVLRQQRLEEDVIVAVTGTVREFDPDDPFEFGGGEDFNFDDEDFSEWEDDEVLVAESVIPIAVD